MNRLPPCWSTLYYLSQLSESVLKAAFDDGSIHPGMSRKDAIALKPTTTKTAPASAAAGTSAPTNPAPELSAVWQTTSREQRRVFLDRLGREGLCAVMSPALLADLRDHVLNLNMAGASKSSAFPVYATDKFHSALACAEQPTPENLARMAAALVLIAKKAAAKGVTRSDIVIAEGKPKGRRK